MSKQPPVPPSSRSPKDQGGKTLQNFKGVKPKENSENLREQGDAGNIRQNTTHKGYQQDR